MSKDNPFGHTNSRYERPQQPYRCGRARRWQKSCWQGPTNNGGCGGTFECRPALQGDRYICRRPAHAGGSCEQGPLPDGQCCNQRPACIPQPTLRKRRGHYVVLAFLLPLLLLIALSNLHEPSLKSPHIGIDPGSLSRVHQEFAGTQGCQTCHENQHPNLSGMMGSLFSESNINAACEQCHGFAGRGQQPHNRIFPDRVDLAETQCLDCHSEHEGDDNLIPQLTDNQCGQACHLQPFSDFAASHPPFTDRFPSETAGSIRFDHSRHFKKYFPQQFRGSPPEMISRAKQCVSCHSVEQATREVKPRRYDEICASCHEQSLVGSTLTVAYPDEPTPITSLLLNIGADDSDAFDDARDEFLESMAEDGVDYWQELLERPLLASAESQQIIDHIDDFPIDEVASAWLEDETIEIENTNGLSADDEGIYYRVNGHQDPFAKAWLELATRQAMASPDQQQLSQDLERIALLASDDEGVSCGKCHSINQAIEIGKIPWQYRGMADRPLSRYSHGPHINLLGLDQSCNNCHRLDNNADFGDYFDLLSAGELVDSDQYQSNFHPIDIATCRNCHNPQGVNDSCSECHQYHQGSTLSGSVLNQVVSSPELTKKTPQTPPPLTNTAEESPL